MLISSEATGGQIVSIDGDARFYDDIGCLAADVAATAPDSRRSRIYVRLSAGDGWIAAAAARFAQLDDEQTPMGSGLLAFRTAEEARAVDRAGQALTWREITKLRSGSDPQFK